MKYEKDKNVLDASVSLNNIPHIDLFDVIDLLNW